MGGAVMANIVGYYPWFATYNTLEEYLPKKDSEGDDFTGVQKLGRRALMGFGASAVCDVSSNSIRVLKVYKQTNAHQAYVHRMRPGDRRQGRRRGPLRARVDDQVDFQW